MPGFLGGMGCDTVLLEPLMLECFRIVVQPALEGPPKFRQHRPVSLSIDGLGVAAAVFKEVGPDDASAAQGTPNCEFSRVERCLCYHVMLLLLPKYEILTVYFAIKVEMGLVAVPDLVDKVMVLFTLPNKPRTEALSSSLVGFCQCLVD